MAKSDLSWKSVLAKYQIPKLRLGIGQIFTGPLPYVTFWFLTYFAMQFHWLLAVPCIVLAAGFYVRLFIVFHDCTHGSYFKSRKANEILGFWTGVLAFTPFHQWRQQHAIHHATTGDLDRRGFGDIWTMTIDEYNASSRWKKLAYRVSRNPAVFLLFGPLLVFGIQHRIPDRRLHKRERRSVHQTNLAILGILVLAHFTIGLKAYLMVQLPIFLLGGAAGVWLFYVQHQFEDTAWARREQWDYLEGALQGSSFYKLPRILQWFSGNIGFHHIHHLNPRIPNYYLEKCHKEHPLFQQAPKITLFSSLKSAFLHLWDEREGKLVSFRRARRLTRERKAAA
ncbi:fatty acid desaturase [Acidobacteria bacterium Mor1]|nr:fatty acid desaturase [Acidobacteria bacterium Mor1]